MDNGATMEGGQPFSNHVAQALENRRRAIEAEELPRLKELFRVLHTSLQGLHQLLVRKGLVQQDPYKSDQKISEVVAPPDDPYPDSEREMTIGVRLDTYDNTLEFLNNYFEFSTQALGFRELRQLTEVARYISWDRFSMHSDSPTTRGIAELVGRARGSHDSFANGIISDSLEQLSRHLRAILEQIKVITIYKREEYKQSLREPMAAALAGNTNPDDPEALAALRQLHKEQGLSGPFIPELAAELIAESTGEGAAQARQAVLDRLQAQAGTRAKKRSGESVRDVLVSAVRALAAASRSLDLIGENLRTNVEISRTQARSVGRRLRDWIDRLTNRRPEQTSFSVEYTDEATGTRQTETVVLDEFLELISRKARLYGSFLSRTGGPWEKLQAASEDQLHRFIEKELGACHLIQRRAGALDEHIKKAAVAERQRMKGVKIELSAVRNAIVASNQLKHEYVARKGELEQMKRLGVDP